MPISITSLTTTTPKAQAALRQPLSQPTIFALRSGWQGESWGPQLIASTPPWPSSPRVRRHGKRAWELLRRAKRFVLVDAAGDYYVDRAGNASRPGETYVHVSKLLDPEKREVR